MEGLELTCFQMISYAGAAKSKFFEALATAKNNDFEAANEMLNEGQELLIQAHLEHALLIKKEANLETVQITLLLLHAEDQLMSAESARDQLREMIELYQVIKDLKDRVER